jgi:hypothetical protein
MREVTRKYGAQFLAISVGLVVLITLTIRFGFTNPIRTQTTVIRPLPETILWAWERPEDLSFLNAKKNASQIGIAYLAKTLTLKGNAVVVRPRFQPVKFPEAATLISVIRIESDGSPDFSAEQRTKTVAEISDIAHQKNIAAVQIDFDAKQSERDFYRNLLIDLRRDWPAQVGLSITALASWCISDTWIKDLPIDEAVPMLFRMGADNNQIRMHLKSGGDFNLDICRLSIGISTDETIGDLPADRRIYIFNPRSWNEQSVNKALMTAIQKNGQ